MNSKKLLLTIAALLSAINISAQGDKTLAELLGYPRDSKLRLRITMETE